jgi:hypothetical protein
MALDVIEFVLTDLCDVAILVSLDRARSLRRFGT